MASTPKRLQRSEYPSPGEPASQAIPRLVELEGGRLYSLGRRFCGNDSDAADLVQQTFLEAYKSWPRFRGDAKPSTWLYSIAARTCAKVMRASHDRAVPLDDAIPEAFQTGPVADLVVTEDSPLAEQISRESIDALRGAIVDLPFAYRAPLILKEIVGIPVQEVADILGLSLGAAKTRLHRARLRLVEALTASGPTRRVPPPRFEAQVCLELLEAKQNALDRGVPFSLPPERFCERCAAVFESMDIATGICRELSEDGLPRHLLDTVRERIGRLGGGN